MMYPFMTLSDETEIVHSDMQNDGRVKVYIERPDEKYGFKHAAEIIRSTAHLIIEFSKEGGFENASNL